MSYKNYSWGISQQNRPWNKFMDLDNSISIPPIKSTKHESIFEHYSSYNIDILQYNLSFECWDNIYFKEFVENNRTDVLEYYVSVSYSRSLSLYQYIELLKEYCHPIINKLEFPEVIQIMLFKEFIQPELTKFSSVETVRELQELHDKYDVGYDNLFRFLAKENKYNLLENLLEAIHGLYTRPEYKILDPKLDSEIISILIKVMPAKTLIYYPGFANLDHGICSVYNNKIRFCLDG